MLRLVGRGIKAARRAAGSTQMALARAGKVSQAFLSHVEIGRCQNLSVGVLLRMAKARRVSPALLLLPTPPTQARGPTFKSRRMRTPVADTMPKARPKTMTDARCSRAPSQTRN